MTQSTPNIAEQLKDVRVGARPELDVSRHVFGGEPAYVVMDPVSFQSHRFSQADYQVFIAINARQTLGKVFAGLVASGHLDADQEEEFYKFVLSLTQRGLLNLPLADGGRHFKRFEERREAKQKGRLMRSLFLRVPLVRPDRFLNRTMFLFKPLFTWGALVVWALCCIASLLVILSRWDEVTSPMASILALGNLPVLWTLLVVLKVIHEFGHAYACKRFGGEVPEMGAYFIMFTPCAYVDASASWGFTSRWQRVIVALAGMYFESIAAMMALAIWVLTPSGTLHDAAYYAVVLSTVVTVAFNANPLMRYDGYYVLSDALGIPNLRAESDKSLRGLATRLLYGVRGKANDGSRKRSLGLAAFGVAGAVYKVMLLLGISLVIAQKLPLVGFGVALMYVVQSLRQSGLSLINYLRFSEELEGRRTRAITTTIAIALAGMVLVSAVPIPGRVESVGVVTRLDEVTVRAAVPGFVTEVFVECGDPVSSDEIICRLDNIDIELAAKQLELQTKATELRWEQELYSARQTAARTQATLDDLLEDRETAEQRRDSLDVRSARKGVITNCESIQVGAFLKRGDPVATVGAGPWAIRVLLTGEQLVDAALTTKAKVRMRFMGNPNKVLEGHVEQVASQGLTKVEREELTHLAGGEIAVDPQSHESANALFEVLIFLEQDPDEQLRSGSTAQVFFPGTRTTLLAMLYRRGLQIVNDLRMLG